MARQGVKELSAMLENFKTKPAKYVIRLARLNYANVNFLTDMCTLRRNVLRSIRFSRRKFFFVHRPKIYGFMNRYVSIVFSKHVSFSHV